MTYANTHPPRRTAPCRSIPVKVQSRRRGYADDDNGQWPNADIIIMRVLSIFDYLQYICRRPALSVPLVRVCCPLWLSVLLFQLPSHGVMVALDTSRLHADGQHIVWDAATTGLIHGQCSLENTSFNSLAVDF